MTLMRIQYSSIDDLQDVVQAPHLDHDHAGAGVLHSNCCMQGPHLKMTVLCQEKGDRNKGLAVADFADVEEYVHFRLHSSDFHHQDYCCLHCFLHFGDVARHGSHCSWERVG